jgi:hypothetical protein
MTLSTAIHNFCTGRCVGCLKLTQGYDRGNRGDGHEPRPSNVTLITNCLSQHTCAERKYMKD